jgi:hypothetical protein
MQAVPVEDGQALIEVFGKRWHGGNLRLGIRDLPAKTYDPFRSQGLFIGARFPRMEHFCRRCAFCIPVFDETAVSIVF